MSHRRAAAPLEWAGGHLPAAPLGGAILFPRSHLPLHIFEERYRAMVEDALAGPGRIAMIQPQTAREGAPLFSIGRRMATGSPYYLNGRLCRLGLWKKVLSGAEITSEDTGTVSREVGQQVEGREQAMVQVGEQPAVHPVGMVGTRLETETHARRRIVSVR